MQAKTKTPGESQNAKPDLNALSPLRLWKDHRGTLRNRRAEVPER
jgi:hypothetical protein